LKSLPQVSALVNVGGVKFSVPTSCRRLNAQADRGAGGSGLHRRGGPHRRRAHRDRGSGRAHVDRQAGVRSRAKYWFNHRSAISYNGSGTYRDPDSKNHKYRRDCSGYVDMALHLSSGPNTVGLPAKGNKISRKNMKMGDFTGILGKGTSGSAGHVRIFEKWKSKSAGTYWAFDFGSAPIKHQVYTLSKDKSRKGTDGKYHGWTAYQYKKIV
jgi:hypothetical protein